MAVYRRLQRTEFVDAELSLRYWSSHDNLFQFAVVPLQAYDSHREAWIAEHELIAQWEAPLNFPGVTSLVKKTALGFHLSASEEYLSTERSACDCGGSCVTAAGSFSSKTPENLPGDCCLSLDPVPEQL